MAAVDRGASIEVVRRASAGCRACDLWRRATQTVFGAGPVPARVMLVGERARRLGDAPSCQPLPLPHARLVTATVHPSSILRAGERRGDTYAAFVRDLRGVAGWLESNAA